MWIDRGRWAHPPLASIAHHQFRCKSCSSLLFAYTPLYLFHAQSKVNETHKIQVLRLSSVFDFAADGSSLFFTPLYHCHSPGFQVKPLETFKVFPFRVFARQRPTTMGGRGRRHPTGILFPDNSGLLVDSHTPSPKTSDPKPQTPNPNPQTRNRTPSTPNSKLYEQT